MWFREETGTRTGATHRGMGPGMYQQTRRDNVGKGHLPAGADSNLQRLTGVGTTEAGERVLVWRMSPYER